MKIIDHGKWEKYRPDELPYGAPPNALFARRESDGVDWYEYVNSGKHFGVTSIKLMAGDQPALGGLIVGPAVYDPTLLFPPGQVVLEITGHKSKDPQAEFGNKVFDREAQTFRDIDHGPPPEPIEDMIRRIVREELKK